MLLLKLRHSPIATCIISLYYLGASAALWLTGLGWWLQISLGSLILVDSIRLLRRAFPGCPDYIQGLRLTDNQCQLILHDRVIKVALPEVIYYSEYLLILGFKVLLPTRRTGKRRCLLLFPDSLAADADRALRRFLRFRDANA